jgi:beta-1,4-mannosyl-glycoprotein beta-1,4-N-acetylglucosaminyltransferase
MKVFDCFTFFNELDLLEFRLKLIGNYVDYFVIAESNLTHSGQEKPYYFRQEQERYKKWADKIIYLPVQQTASGLVFEEQHKYNPGSAAWQLENQQRNALLDAAKQMNKNDLVLVSDLDEIPSPAAIKMAKATDTPVAFSLLFHYYFLNCQNTGNSRWWKGTIACTAKQFTGITPQGLRDKRDQYPSISHAGWHFSFLGGVEKIKEKLLSFAHTEFSKAEYTSEEHIHEALQKGEDILKREGVNFRYLPLSYYPAALQKVMREYPALLNLPKDSFFINFYYTLRRLAKGNF